MYGWYSLDAYQRGEPEYIYINNYGQETLCTCMNHINECPDKVNKDIVYIGILNNFVKKNISSKIIKIYNLKYNLFY